MDGFLQLLQQEKNDITRMDAKARIARAFAASYLWNRRNLEGHWYARSDQVWHDLTSPFPDMIVVPQYPLWLPSELEGQDDEGADDGDTDNDEARDADEKIAGTELAESQPVILVEPDDDGQNCVEVEATEDSLITIPEPNAAELIPDFVILHFRTQPLPPDHPRFLQLAGIRITHECCPIIIENKRMPQRRTDIALFDGSFRDDLEEHIYEAIDDLETQCAYAFKKYKHALSIIAVAVAGDYWSHVSVPFNIVPPVDDEYTLVRSKWNTLVWPAAVAFGTSQSDARLAELRSVLEGKARSHNN